MDEVVVLRDTLSAHRSMLMGALTTNDQLDIDRAVAAHAGWRASSPDDFADDLARVRALQSALGYA